MPLIPTVVEADGRLERSFDIYSRLLRERIVFLGREIDDDIANIVVAQLLFLAAEDPAADINLYVNSPGGSVTAGNASGVNGGAAAVLVASEAAVERFGLRPLARITGLGTAGVEPRIMGIGPVPAMPRSTTTVPSAP